MLARVDTITYIQPKTIKITISQRYLKNFILKTHPCHALDHIRTMVMFSVMLYILKYSLSCISQRVMITANIFMIFSREPISIPHSIPASLQSSLYHLVIFHFDPGHSRFILHSLLALALTWNKCTYSIYENPKEVVEYLMMPRTTYGMLIPCFP